MIRELWWRWQPDSICWKVFAEGLYWIHRACFSFKYPQMIMIRHIFQIVSLCNREQRGRRKVCLLHFGILIPDVINHQQMLTLHHARLYGPAQLSRPFFQWRYIIYYFHIQPSVKCRQIPAKWNSWEKFLSAEPSEGLKVIYRLFRPMIGGCVRKKKCDKFINVTHNFAGAKYTQVAAANLQQWREVTDLIRAEDKSH